LNLFVPGRICLFGEHSDWAGGYRRANPAIEKGYTLITGTDQGIYAEVEAHPDSLHLMATDNEGTQLGLYQIPMQPQTLLAEAQKGGFWSYIAGTAYVVLERHAVGGLVINNYKTTLPIKKGLSSSAAICVLTARAFNLIYDLNLTVRDEMELAYLGEITTPSRCGRMDQGCAFGRRPIMMTFDGDEMEVKELPIEGIFHLVVVDLQAEKDTQRILADLNTAFPEANDPVARGVQELLGPINRRIVTEARLALEQGDAQRLGALMSEAQSHFDRLAAPASPKELASRMLHKVLAHPPLQQHIWGGKGVGSQGDGSVQLLARSGADQRAVVRILERDFQMPSVTMAIAGASPIRKVLIPAAGFGTRMFPASKALRKELFPIIDQDGIAKPAILLLVEEALSAGVEEVIIIVQPEDRADFENFFHTPISPAHYIKLPAHLQGYADHLAEIGQRVQFAVQERQEGFGHAVYCARELLGDSPFMLLLGDHLYQTSSPRSCARQLVQAYRQHETSLVGLQKASEDQLAHRGVVTGTWIDDGRLLSITRFMEKPGTGEARVHARVEGLPEGEYLVLSGQYIIHPKVFDYLEANIAENRRERGEIQLTTALEQLRASEGFYGLVVDGETFDIGQPHLYLRTLRVFGSR